MTPGRPPETIADGRYRRQTPARSAAPGSRRYTMTEKSRLALAEAIGTLILVVGGPGTAVLATGGFLKTNSVGELGVALAFGLSLLCAAYAIGSISGCHINPAVTFGMWIAGKTHANEIPWYLGGQIIGGIAGGAIIFVIADSINGFSAKASGFASNGYGKHSPGGFGLGAAITVEIVFTALFIFVSSSSSRARVAVRCRPVSPASP
jgi:aquaporin Z